MKKLVKVLGPLAALVILFGLVAMVPALTAGPGTASPASPAGAQAPQVDVMIKTPYLIYPGTVGQMEVLWQLSGTYVSTIEWGTDLTYSTGSALSSEYGTANQHAYTIGDLLPATRYYYRITTLGVAYTGSFLSAPAGSATQLKFLAYGDTRTYPDTHNLVAGAILSAINADSLSQTFTLFMGDYVANGCTESYWTSEWFPFAQINIRSLTAKVPYAGCMGNHETYPSGQTLFPKYFPYPFAGSRYYYSFDYGPVHVTVLDLYTAYDSTSTQGLWFKNDLASSTKPWKFVLLHEPGWAASNTCGTGHTNNTTVQSQVEPFCERYGVAAVFAGHSHYYARAVVNGIQHITTGGGGAPLNTGCLGQPNEVAYASVNHYCKVAIDGGVLQFQAINRSTGAVIDSFTLVRTIPDTTPPSVAITSPDGGEDWKAGSSHSITWTATDNVGVTAVDLAYSTDGGMSFPNSIAAGLTNSGSYPWGVPNTPTGTARVRVTAHDAAENLGADSSAAEFTISTWTITASAGPGGSVVPSGAVPVVEGASQHFSIAPDSGNQVATLTVDGSPVTPDTTYTFTNVTADRTLDATFADVTGPTVHVTSPVGGERWDMGSSHSVTWTASDNEGVDSVNVDYSATGSAGPWLPVAHGLSNSGSCPWSLPGQPSDNAFVRVTAFDHALNPGSDASDSLFHIVDPNAAVGDGGPAVLALSLRSPTPGPERPCCASRCRPPGACGSRSSTSRAGGCGSTRRNWGRARTPCVGTARSSPAVAWEPGSTSCGWSRPGARAPSGSRCCSETAGASGAGRVSEGPAGGTAGEGTPVGERVFISAAHRRPLARPTPHLLHHGSLLTAPS